ncbi:MAG: RNA-binding domain-containing protein [Pseudomonadales bacterium]|jgi:ATP-dependent DNA helicase RecG|nr:RNA-binding domain-containing protein [Pseudomonadales bacterium]
MTPDELLECLDLGESQDIEFKLAQGGFPTDAWRSVSAFANSAGGHLVLGVREKAGRQFEIAGVGDPAALLKVFWDGHNNLQRLSKPLCNDADVTVHDVGGRKVIVIAVPAASRTQRPVFIGGNPFTGTYKRNHEGDYRCTEPEVRRMFRDASDEPQDSRILPHFGVDDLDAETLEAFRQRFRSREPDHPFLAQDDLGLLTQLGGWRRDRATGDEGLTLAGLLMFGRERSLLDALPRFQLDYQEKDTDDPEERWQYRVTLDGRWQPNLFNFYYRVYPRLVDGLDVPFRLDRDGVRLGETHVHEALREALVNTLVHADHEESPGVLVRRTPDGYLFRNAGRLRVPLEHLYDGGVSDPRNPSLQKMFQLLGLGEKAGSGIPKILRAWHEQEWLRPLITEAPDRELTTLKLPLASLVPEDVERELRAIVGDAYGDLRELDRIILQLAHRFGEIGNADVQSYCQAHARDIGAHLKSLVQQGWLRQSGQARGTRYRLPDHAPSGQLFASAGSGPAPEASPVGGPGIEQNSTRSEHSDADSEHYSSSSEHYGPSSEHYADLATIAAPVREKGRANKELVRQTILALCSGRALELRALADLLNRSPDSVRNHYVAPMLREGLLQARYPNQPNHPGQAYIAADAGNPEP